MSRFVFVASLAAGTLLASCLDFSPLPYADPGSGTPDASVSDAADRDAPSSDAMIAACQECLSSGPCAGPYSACTGNSVCVAFAGCLSAKSCWGSSLTDLSHLTPCILQCGGQAGLTGQGDPAALLVSPVFLCAQDPTKCGPQCAPQAAAGH